MLRTLRDAALAALTLGTLGATLAAQGGLPPVPVPPANPITVDKALLGKALFWDEQLSSTNSVSCGTCHIPSAGGADPRSLFDASTHPGPDGVFGTPDDKRGARGVIRADAAGLSLPAEPFVMREQVTDRQPPSMINAAFSPTLFWDGRAGGPFLDPQTGETVLFNGGALENQAVGPPLSDVEMAHVDRDWDAVVAKLASVQPLALATDVPADLAAFVAGRDYGELFADAFPGSGGAITAARLGLALATYERTLISDQTPFDAFLAGVPGSLTPQQNQGRQVFIGPGRCVICHGGPQMTDNQFHAIGVRPPAEDLGRGAVTGLPQDSGRFRTPGLRNVALRAPYFHNGGMQTLADVVDFYDRGGDFGQNQDPAIIPLGLTQQQKNALVAFLQGALIDPRVAGELPPFDRPTLASETSRRPELFAAGGVGSGGFVPRAVAVEPPLLGTPALAFGMADGLGGAPVLLGLDLAAGPPGVFLRHTPFLLAATPALKFVSAGTLSPGGPGDGTKSLVVALPDDPGLDGVELVLQWFVLDPGTTGGVASSDGTRLEFFAAE